MAIPLADRCAALLAELEIASANEVISIDLLDGGVASDVAAVRLPGRLLCAKFAFAKLRVAADWRVPVDRNQAEYAWLAFAGETVPGSAPVLYGHVPTMNGFAMEFVQGRDVYLWKQALLQGRGGRAEGAKVGQTLGVIHATSSLPGFNASKFQNHKNFYQLRLDPYFGHTARAHPELAVVLQRRITSLRENSTVLIHGDVSPKNILFRNGDPVFIDAECATMGDPAFDVAFCLNHLILKCIHMPHRFEALSREMHALWGAYASHVEWETVDVLENRICMLVPALMLARIDGKSPVEYLTDEQRVRVRALAINLLQAPPASLDELTAKVDDAIKGQK